MSKKPQDPVSRLSDVCTAELQRGREISERVFSDAVDSYRSNIEPRIATTRERVEAYRQVVVARGTALAGQAVVTGQQVLDGPLSSVSQPVRQWFSRVPGFTASTAAAPAQTATKKQAAKKPAAKKPAAKKPAAKKPAAKKPVAKKTAAKKPVTKKPSSPRKPAAKKPVSKKPVAKKPVAAKPAAKVTPTATSTVNEVKPTVTPRLDPSSAVPTPSALATAAPTGSSEK